MTNNRCEFSIQKCEQKKYFCGCEGTVAEKGSRNLAFVCWSLNFLLCLYVAKNSFCSCLFFGLLVTPKYTYLV